MGQHTRQPDRAQHLRPAPRLGRRLKRPSRRGIGVLKVIGKQGKAVGQFQGVRGVSIGKDGTIYVVDQYNNRVSAYDKDGGRKWIVVTGLPGNEKPVKKSTLPTQGTAPAAMQIPGGMTIDGAGRLVIADPFGFDLTALNGRDGSLNAKYGAPGNVDGQFIYPSSVAYDSSRDWFAIADKGNQRVQIVRLPGSAPACCRFYCSCWRWSQASSTGT